MRILVVATDAFGGYGGIAQYNRDLVEALAGLPEVSQVDVVVRFAPDPPGDLPPQAVQHPAQRRRSRLSLQTLSLALRTRPDLVICGHLHLAPLAAAAARLIHRPMLVQTHGVEVWSRPSPVRRRSFETAACVLCVSRDTRARVLDWADIAPERVRVAPNTVADVFTPGDRGAARSRFGLGQGRYILSVSRLDPGQKHKGQDRVIRAMPELLSRGLDATYLIAGVGGDEARLKSLAQELGVADRVRFLGRVPQDALPDLYRAADLFALPSTGDGFGIVFIEAMACGTPALGLAAGGAVDALADGELGLAVAESHLVDALASALTAPAPDPQALSDAVRARFGRDLFKARIAEAVRASVQ